MINVRRLTVIVFLGAGLLPGISAQESSVQTVAQNEMNLPRPMGFTVVHRLCVATEHYDSQKPGECGKYTDRCEDSQSCPVPPVCRSQRARTW